MIARAAAWAVLPTLGAVVTSRALGLSAAPSITTGAVTWLLATAGSLAGSRLGRRSGSSPGAGRRVSASSATPGRRLATCDPDDLEAMILQENLTSLGRLAGGVAHELGNPLNTISSIAQLLRRRRASDPFVHEQARAIENHVARLSRLSRLLIDLAFPKRPRLAVFDARTTIAETLKVASLDRRLKRCRLESRMPPAPLQVRGDEGAIHLILLNLLFNAADAVDGQNGSILVSACQSDLGIEVRVIDNGPGVPEEDRPRIFAPFFTTKEPGEGTGVGLSVSCRLARAVGGELNLERTGPDGSCFLLYLATPEEIDALPDPGD